MILTKLDFSCDTITKNLSQSFLFGEQILVKYIVEINLHKILFAFNALKKHASVTKITS